MATILKTDDRVVFEDVIRSFEAQIANVGVHLTIDSTARLAYAREIKVMADKLRQDATTGKLTWTQAAQQAQETRNLVMTIVRGRSTPVGLALAQKIKADGKSLNELVARQTRRLHGQSAVFSQLSASQKNTIYASVVTSAGKSNVAVTSTMSRLSYAGKGVIVVSLALSVYNIATSADMATTARNEVLTNGAGIGGGIAGGALAGLVCGPGAPACVTVGAFVGGALAAFGSSFVW